MSPRDGEGRTPRMGPAVPTTPATMHSQSSCRSDVLAAVTRQRREYRRAVPLSCGCRWTCFCSRPPLSDSSLDAWRDAAVTVMKQTGATPLLPVEVLRALYRRGGDDRALAEQLHRATAAAVA